VVLEVGEQAERLPLDEVEQAHLVHEWPDE
jgi:hypothetical protein